MQRQHDMEQYKKQLQQKNMEIENLKWQIERLTNK